MGGVGAADQHIGEQCTEKSLLKVYNALHQHAVTKPITDLKVYAVIEVFACCARAACCLHSSVHGAVFMRLYVVLYPPSTPQCMGAALVRLWTCYFDPTNPGNWRHPSPYFIGRLSLFFDTNGTRMVYVGLRYDAAKARPSPNSKGPRSKQRSSHKDHNRRCSGTGTGAV